MDLSNKKKDLTKTENRWYTGNIWDIMGIVWINYAKAIFEGVIGYVSTCFKAVLRGSKQMKTRLYISICHECLGHWSDSHLKTEKN